MKPYYDHNGITIYHGDCLDILPELGEVDLVLTDPPYPDNERNYPKTSIYFLDKIICKQIIFWSAKTDFPLDYTAIHIWDKKTGCGSEYEKIVERNGQKNYKVYRYYLINSIIAANYTGDVFCNHPDQKPLRLLRDLIKKNIDSMNGIVLDPFLGSGTTAVACKQLGRKCIGIEIEEKYCEIAVKRLSQEVINFEAKIE